MAGLGVYISSILGGGVGEGCNGLLGDLENMLWPSLLRERRFMEEVARCAIATWEDFMDVQARGCYYFHRFGGDALREARRRGSENERG